MHAQGGGAGAFASQLRASEKTLLVGEPNSKDSITLRVQVPEVWDLVRIETSAATPVSVIKDAALLALLPDFASSDEFLMKINGFEILDESTTAANAGARDGSTFLLSFRRRRPVR